MLPDNPDLKNRILNHYPLPIAFEYAQLTVFAERNDLSSMYSQLAHTYEIIVRYLTSIILSILRTQAEELTGSAEREELDTYIRENIEKPGLKACLGILKRAGKWYQSRQILFMPELVKFINASDGVELTGLRLIEELLPFYEISQQPIRHSLDQAHAREYLQNNALVLKLLQELGFLIAYPLVRLEQVGEAGHWHAQVFKGGQRILEGQVQIKELESVSLPLLGGKPTDEYTLGTYDQRAQCFLGIYPYALFQVCDQCLKEKRNPFHDLFLYKGQHSQHAVYQGIADTQEHQPHSHLVSLNLVLDQLWPKSQNNVSAEARVEHLQHFLETAAQSTLGLLHEKYNVELYVHRQKIEQSIHDFMASEQPALLIVGDSGTGKTNLMMTLARDLLAAGKLVILQNCATWDLAAVEAGAGRYLSSWLGLSPNVGIVERLGLILEEVKPAPEVYLLMEALNEAVHPAKLLRSLEEQVLLQLGNRNWIKVIVTCRTESWRRLQNSLRNEKFFFKTEGTLEHRLTKFSEAELREAYPNYQYRYKLRSALKEIAPDVIELLQYPLMLRLVAESFVGRPIPQNLSLGELFQRYDEEKLGRANEAASHQSERVFIDYLLTDFLERKADRTRWESLDKATDENVRSWAQDRWSPKSPYVILLDMGILLEVVRPDGDVEIRFLYDQYLEFKLAQKVIPPGTPVSVEEFVKLIEQAQDFPALYGALKSFLVTRNRDQTSLELDRFVRDLAEVNDIRVRSLLSDFCVTVSGYSQQGRNQVLSLLADLYKRNPSAGGLAVTVAYLLNDLPMLHLGLISLYQSVRKQATLYAFSLWQTDTQSAQKLFERLSQRMANPLRTISGTAILRQLQVGEKIVIFQGLEPLLDLSVLMIPLAYRRPEAARIAGQQLVSLLDRIPRPLTVILDALLAPYGRKTILNILSGRDTESDKGSWQETAVRHFFQRAKTDPLRGLCAEILSYFKPGVGSLQGELGDKIFNLAQEPDRFIYLSIVQVLMPRFEHHYQEIYQFAQRLYFQGNTHSQYLALRYFTLCTFLALDQPDCGPRHIEFANQMILDFLTSDKLVEYKGENQPYPLDKSEELNHFGFGVLYEMHEREHGEFDFVNRFLELPWPSETIEARTELVLAGFTGAFLFSTALARPKIGPMLETLLRWITTYENLTGKEKEALIRLLALLRATFPNEVDLYLMDASPKLKLEVGNKTEPVNIYRLSVNGMQAGVPWFHAYVPELRQGFERNLIRIARGEAGFEKIAAIMGGELANMKNIRAIANALARAGKPSSP